VIRQAICVLAALALAACAGPDGPRRLRPIASPSDVIAAELAFARMAQEKGQWTAFAEYAADDAVMFVPEPVNAGQWLKGRANPPRAVTWQPHQVWMSCDGSLALTRGAWQRPDGSTGYFTTVWKRQNDDQYKWVMDQGDLLAEPLPAPEFVQGDVATCGKPGEIVVQAEGPSRQYQGSSKDGTLQWHVSVDDDLARELTVHVSRGTRMEQVLDSKVAAPGTE
jgi:hypothetical protein